MLIGSDALFVGYKNNQQAISDIQSGRLSFMIIDLVGAKGMADNGYAATRRCSPPAFLRCPTCRRRRRPGCPRRLTTRSGFMRPLGAPREIIRSSTRISRAGTSPETSAKLDALGGSRDFTTPEEFAAFTASELEAWRKVIRAADIRAE